MQHDHVLKKLNLSFWPQALSPLRGSDQGLWSKITFDMFHIYYTSWHKFWHLDPSVGRGSLLAKYFLPCCCTGDSSLIWYATGPCSEQVEFWPIDAKGWVGGLPAKYLLPFCCIGAICLCFEKVVFWHLDPQCWPGGGLLAKHSLLWCCMCDSF